MCCNSLKIKENYYNNFNARNITDKKQLWKTVKLFLSNKVGGNGKMTLIEEDKVASEENDVTETFKSYFETIVENLGVNSEYMSEELAMNQ